MPYLRCRRRARATRRILSHVRRVVHRVRVRVTQTMTTPSRRLHVAPVAAAGPHADAVSLVDERGALTIAAYAATLSGSDGFPPAKSVLR